MNSFRDKVCKDHGITRNFFDNMDYGSPRRREYIDDVSIIVISLKN